MPALRPRLGRETRLLLATIAISAGTLIVLAWFRFPEQPAPPPPVREQPLERLAARAAYDELNATIARIEGLVAPGVVVLRSAPDPANSGPDGGALTSPRLSAALRLGDGLAVAAVPGTDLIEELTDRWVPAPVLAHDTVRGLTVVRVAEGRDSASLLSAGRIQASPVTPGYAVAVEGAPRGPALRPVFVGRLDPARRAAWPEGWFVPAAIAPFGAGVVVTDLEGRLVGMTAGASDTVLVPAQALEAAARRLLTQGPAEPGDLGVEVSSLSLRLLDATGSAGGAIVTRVRPGGPAAAELQPGDVVERIGEQPVRSPRELADAIRATAPGTRVTLTFRRDRQERRVELTLASAEAVSAAHDVPEAPVSPGARLLGLAMQSSGTGARVTRVSQASAAMEAGLQAGDVIAWFAGTDRPSPAAVRRLFDAAAPGPVLLAVDRDGTRLVLAVEKR